MLHPRATAETLQILAVRPFCSPRATACPARSDLPLCMRRCPACAVGLSRRHVPWFARLCGCRVLLRSLAHQSSVGTLGTHGACPHLSTSDYRTRLSSLVLTALLALVGAALIHLCRNRARYAASARQASSNRLRHPSAALPCASSLRLSRSLTVSTRSPSLPTVVPPRPHLRPSPYPSELPPYSRALVRALPVGGLLPPSAAPSASGVARPSRCARQSACRRWRG